MEFVRALRIWPHLGSTFSLKEDLKETKLLARSRHFNLVHFVNAVFIMSPLLGTTFIGNWLDTM